MGLLPYKNEPYLDWTDESNQKAMRRALEGVESSLGRSYPLIIGGERVETDGEIVSVNPSNPSQVVGRTGRATEREADMALETATKTFGSWSKTEPERGRASSCGLRPSCGGASSRCSPGRSTKAASPGPRPTRR
jgi:1-pyrroline-5-carboxylate dehydrogenase